MSVNKVIVMGRLGKDPELKATPSGASVCNFSVATSEAWKDKQGVKQEKTEWHNIVTWNKTAENCNKFLSKGSQVYIEGKIETRKWQDKEGKDRYMTEIKAMTVQFIGSKSSDQAPTNTPSNDFKQDTFDTDSIPF